MKTEPQELRAKYNQSVRDTMAKSGAAMSDGSFPIADVTDLRCVIRAVSRGGTDHDAVRAHVIKRAKTLGHSDMVPDNWNAGGSLERAAGVWEGEEQRETFSDLMTALDQALIDEVGNSWSCWIQDMDESCVYYQSGGTLYSRPYTVTDGGPVTLGDATRVRPVTSYVPSETDGARSEPRRRFAAKTLEFRRQRAEEVTDLDRTRPERRQHAGRVELRESGDGDGVTLVSYASLFNTPYSVGGSNYRYEEKVLPGAFTRTLNAGPDVVLRTEHSSMPLARTTSGTLKLFQDEKGLRYEAELNPEDPDVRALLPKIERGDMNESSFAFRCTDDSWSEDFTERSLKACDLHRGDVSIVTFGASPATGRHMLLRGEEEALAALRRVGAEAFIEAWVEWRDYSLLPIEQRAGKKLSAGTMDTLQSVLALVARADAAVDEAQPLLADLMGVPNPDADDDAGAGDAETNAAARSEESEGEEREEEQAPEAPKQLINLRELRRELKSYELRRHGKRG